MRQKRLGELRDDIRQSMTLEHDKTHCGRGMITDRILHVVKDAAKICGLPTCIA